MGRRLVVVAERDHDFVDLDDRDTVTIGRSPDNDVIVKDDMVSRRHAVFEKDAEGSLRIRDLKSFNGTYLNERRVRDEPVELWDAVRVGRTKLFLVERDETPPLVPGESGAQTAQREPAEEEAEPEVDPEEAMGKTRTLDVSTGLASKEMRAVVEDVVRKERESLEREVARRIRDESGPSLLGSLPGFRVRIQRDGPLDGGGDFYDAFRDALLPNDLFLATGSVSGVGVAACVAATVARHTLRGYLASRDEGPDESLVPACDVLGATLHPGSALSLILARLDETGRVRLAAVGGCGALHYKSAKDEVEVVRAPGRRDEEAARVQAAELKLDDGDRLILTSDGGGALRRADGEPYGVERLQASFAEHAKLGLKELLARLSEGYAAYDDGKRERDVTLIALAPKGATE